MPGLHVRSRKVDVAATLCSSATEAAARLDAAMEMPFGAEDDQQWQNPRILDRESSTAIPF